MVYIDRNGRIWEKRPWDWQRVVEIFVGLWYIILQFFQTLLAPFNGGNGHNRDNRNSRSSGWGSGGGGGGGGGSGGGGGGGGGGLRPNRRIGRIQQQDPVNGSACSMGGG
ncbi:glycine-rich selenoprotein [Drosophila innubila]|uniref:glycine-rich selenoprotein n=1 Tax=Drosophila innubila TaxID=198719 RepID=UPI00148E7E9F|nr:glycine-rich selenoprotein [Drosophila innubila]